MSSENEDPLLERGSESQRNTTVPYTRDELLFFSNICSKFPSGFDSSVLSELDESFIALNERQRGSGGSIFHSVKNSDYTSLPQTRPNSALSFYCGSFGRWDARSSESNIRDGDFQSNRETNIQDNGKRVGTQSRHYAQHAEHDGLPETGTYQRPSGSEEPVMEKSRAVNQFQLNKTPESYQPQRTYKALQFQPKDSKDLCNDENFGTNGYSNEDRTEERRRRESFELIRKEQQKALHEKQKQIPDNHRQNLDAGIIALLDSSSDEEVPSKSQIKFSRVSTHSPLSRPLVPPGFASTSLDKILPAQSVSFASENQGFKMDEEPWAPSLSESSKFSSWSAEENKLSEDFSSKNLLSLIANKGKVGSSSSLVSHDKLFNNAESGSITSNDARQKFDASPTTALMVEVSERFNRIDKPDQNHVVLTCEELEQSIFADLEGMSNMQHAVHRPGIVTDENMKHQKSDIDDEASQHLLSLLRKGAKKEKEMTFGTSAHVDFLDKLSLTDNSPVSHLAIPGKNTSEIIFSSEKSMILEALFGAPFMNELQFAQAPVSTRGAVIDDENNIDAFPSSAGLLFPKSDAIFCSRSDNCQLKKFVRQKDIAPLSKAGFEEKFLEFHLPDEDSLIIESDILEPVISDHSPFVDTSKNKETTLQSRHDMDRACPLRHDFQGMKASNTIHYTRPLHPLLQHLENGNQQIKHIGSKKNLNVPQNIIENVVPHNASNHAGIPGMCPTSYDMMLQQMSIPGKLHQQLPLPSFARGIQLPYQIIFLERYTDNIPLQQQQPNIGSFGIGIPGAVAGGVGNHPEAFQRLVEMEMRANLEHPFPAAAGHIPSPYGPEFRY